MRMGRGENSHQKDLILPKSSLVLPTGIYAVPSTAQVWFGWAPGCRSGIGDSDGSGRAAKPRWDGGTRAA